jgi:NAD(P)-dependent dehydrogenase (short-subunit alcohol dehydrogenase family)
MGRRGRPKKPAGRPRTRAPLRELRGRVAVITGAGSGIGRALALECARSGMRVVAVDLDAGSAQDTARGVSELGAEGVAEALDVSDAAALERLAAGVYGRFGACHLLCNNAGVAPLGVSWEGTPAEWSWTLDVNLHGVVNGVRAFVPRMLGQGSGAQILNTASLAALRNVPVSGMYNASKHAVLGYSENLRAELAPHGIGVTALCPGSVATDIGTSDRRKPGGALGDAQREALAATLVAGVERAHATSIGPERVAQLALAGIRRNEPYVVTTPGSRAAVVRRFAAILRAFDVARRRGPDLP